MAAVSVGRNLRWLARSQLLAAVVVVALTGVLVEVTASDAGVRSRAGTIAFLRSVGTGPGRPSSLLAIHADGSGLRRLTPSGLDVASFEWSPDGSRIAYLDVRGALRLVRPDGTGRELLARDSPLRSPWALSWSPDGKWIAVLARDPGTPPAAKNAGSDFRIYLIPTEGGEPRRLPSGAAQELDWSPRGVQIVYGPGRQRIIRIDGSKPRPFFPRPQTQGFALATWSPDGTHVGFAGHCCHGPWYNAIYVADADGVNLHLVTRHADNEYGFAWSPDGRWILYGRENRGGTFVIGADGRNNHWVTRDWPTPTELPALTWAPDGRSIAYATDRTGNGDIYLIDTDGHHRLRLTHSAAIDGDPSWQPQ